MGLLEFEFPSDDSIDNNAHQLVSKLFGIEGAWLSDRSSLYNFDTVWEIPGHRLIKFTEIPLEDRSLYKLPSIAKPDKYYDWYPPVKEEDWDQIRLVYKQKLSAKILEIYGISMDDYPDDDLLVYEVAEYIQHKKANQYKQLMIDRQNIIASLQHRIHQI